MGQPAGSKHLADGSVSERRRQGRIAQHVPQRIDWKIRFLQENSIDARPGMRFGRAHKARCGNRTQQRALAEGPLTSTASPGRNSALRPPSNCCPSGSASYRSCRQTACVLFRPRDAAVAARASPSRWPREPLSRSTVAFHWRALDTTVTNQLSALAPDRRHWRFASVRRAGWLQQSSAVRQPTSERRWPLGCTPR